MLTALCACGGTKPTQDSNGETQVSVPTFSADSAYAYIAAQCSYGPRTMNSAAHDSCGNWIAEKFRSFGCTITDQYADSRLYDGTPIRMRNIIASLNPEADVRIIVSSHWDSRPWADYDPDEANHHTPISGANDGASGVGIMLELARIINAAGVSDTIASPIGIGIDFICWDAEDCGTPAFDDDDNGDHSSTWCLGSQYWAGTHHVSGYTARYGIVLDMVGNANTLFWKEGYSMHFAPAIVGKVWDMAQRLGYGNYFENKEGGYITDDHVQVNYGGIPCIDIIGRDAQGESFPATWHTTADNIDNISRQTLKAVGETVLNVLYTE